MPRSNTIINTRNMTTVYSSWIGLLVLTMAIIALTYVLQFTTPFIDEKSSATWITFVAIGGVVAILVMLFKLVFKREILAWWLCQLITISGLVCFLVYGWNWLFAIFFVVSIALQVALGPFLHFE